MNTLTNYLKFSTYWLLVGFMQYSWILVAVGIITAVALKNHYSSAATPVLHTAPSVYGNDPNLGIYSFLRDDESSPFNTAGQQYRRNNSVYLSRIAQISGFWGAQHLQFGCDKNELFFDSTHIFDGTLGCSQIYRLRLPHRRLYQPLGGTPWRGFLDLLIPEGQSPSEVQRLLSAEGLFNMEHPFPVCNNDDDDNHQHMRILFSSASSTDHPSVAVANNKDLSSIDRCGRQLAHRGAEDICNFVTLHDDGTMWKAKEAQRCDRMWRDLILVGRLDPRNDIYIAEIKQQQQLFTNINRSSSTMTAAKGFDKQRPRRLTSAEGFDGFPWVMKLTSRRTVSEGGITATNSDDGPATNMMVIYYTAVRPSVDSGGMKTAEIWRMTLDDKQMEPQERNNTMQQITASPNGGLSLRPVVSPDGRWLVVECILPNYWLDKEDRQWNRLLLNDTEPSSTVLDDTGKISVGIAKFRAPSIFRHLYNQSAVRLCLVDLTDSRLLRGQPIQPQELVFTTSTPNLSGFSSSHAVFDAGRLFQFSGPVFIVADDDGVGDDVGGLGEKKKLKLVFSARHRSFVSNTVSKTNQRFDSSLFISNLDGTQLEQITEPLDTNGHVAVDWRRTTAAAAGEGEGGGGLLPARIAWAIAKKDGVLRNYLSNSIFLADLLFRRRRRKKTASAADLLHEQRKSKEASSSRPASSADVITSSRPPLLLRAPQQLTWPLKGEERISGEETSAASADVYIDPHIRAPKVGDMRPRFSADRRTVYFERWQSPTKSQKIEIFRVDAASPLSRRSKQQLKKRRVLGSIDDEAAARFNSYSPSPVVQISTTGSNPARSVVPLRGVHDGLLLFSVGPAIWKYTTLGLPIEPVLAAAAMTNGGGGAAANESPSFSSTSISSTTPHSSSSYTATDFCRLNGTHALLLYTEKKKKKKRFTICRNKRNSRTEDDNSFYTYTTLCMAGIKDAHRLVKNPPKQQFVQQRPKPRLTLMEETNGTSTKDGVKIPFHKLELSNDPQTLGDFFGDLARTATKENPFWTTIPLASSQEPLWLNTPSSSCLNGGGAEDEEEAKQEGVMNELKAEEQFWYYNDEGGPARFSPDCSAIVFTASNMVSSPPPPSRNSSSSAAVAVTELVVMEPSVSLRSSGKLPAWAWDWATRRNTTLNSYSAAAAELTTRLVTQLGRQSRGPVWMPDGQRVLFSSSSNHSQPALLYMVTVEDEERRHDEFDESSSSNTTINNCAANNTVQEIKMQDLVENSDDAGSGDDDSPDHSWSSSLMLLNGVIDVDVVWTPEEDCCRLVWSSSVPLAGHHHQHQRCGNSTAAEQQNSNSSSQQQNQNAGTYNNTTTMALFIADLEC